MQIRDKVKATSTQSERSKSVDSVIQPADLGFLVTLAGQPSLSATARELGLSKAAVSKRLALIEQRAGLALVRRSTRRMALTPEGEAVVERARHILGQMDEIGQLFARSKALPRGLLRVNATLGFGRSHVAPVISRFVRQHPEVDVQLQLSVYPPPLTDDAYDVGVRFGAPPDARVIAWRLVPNRRLLCASPAYLQRAGVPRMPQDLLRHQCIGIRQGDEAYGTWRLTTGRGRRQRTESVKTRGNLTTNDGEIAVRWARHRDARRVGHRTPSRCRPPGSGAASMGHARGRHLCGGAEPPAARAAGAGLRRLSVRGLRYPGRSAAGCQGLSAQGTGGSAFAVPDNRRLEHR
jgi:DNA-binding transcriptional LysR family regulator